MEFILEREVDAVPCVVRDASVATAIVAARCFLLHGGERSRQGGAETIWREYTARKARTTVKATQKYRFDTTFGGW